MMKPVKNHAVLLVASIAAGIYASVSNNPGPWLLDGSEVSVGNFVRCGFSIIGAYLLMRLFWPKKK